MPTKMMRWVCPNDDNHEGKLAPSRPRKDDIRRYCLVCSEKTGRLVERVAPRLEAKREKAKAKTRVKAAKRRVKATARLAQVDLPTRFVNAAEFATRMTIYTLRRNVLLEVRPVDAPRATRIKQHIHGSKINLITIYDHGGDKYTARAQTIMAEMRWYARNIQGDVPWRNYIRQLLEKTVGIRPRFDDAGKADAGKAEQEVEELLRRADEAKAAVEKLGHNVTLRGTIMRVFTGRMSA